MNSSLYESAWNWLQRRKVLKWGGYAATALSVLWSGLTFLVAKDELHLLVWVDQSTTLYPSDQTWKGALPLAYGDTSVHAVRLLSVIVSNYGKTMIGKQDATWDLNFQAPGAVNLVAVDDPQPTPSSVVARVLSGQKANSLALELGALQPRASVKLHLMLLNSSDSEYAMPLKAEPTLTGLPHEVTFRTPVEKANDRLFLPVWLSVFLLCLVWEGPEIYQKARQGRTGARFAASLAGRFLLLLISTFILGGFLTRGMAHVLTWFV